MQHNHFQIFKPSNLQITFYILLVITLNSCNHDNKAKDIKDASPYFINLFSGNVTTLFRNQNFNSSLDEVKKIETSKLYESTADHLFYEFSYPKDSTPFLEYANIQYFFNEKNELDIITSDIFLSDSIQVLNLRNSLTQYFIKLYGNAEKNENGYDIWKSEFDDKKLNKKFPFTVAINDLTDEYGIKLEYLRE
jgi:hypothetical protein